MTENTVRYTAENLLNILQVFIARRPEVADWPVHMITYGDQCFLTDVELDKFDEDEGMVVSLVAEADR